MPLTTAQQVRLRIQDPWRRGSEVQYGDGIASSFQLAQGAPYSTLISATASVVNTGWSATGCTFDLSLGYVTFSGIPSANTAVRFDYQWAVFGDEEVGTFTAAGGGTVRGAAREAVRTLRFNALKRARWAAPDGTTYDDTAAIQALKALQDDLEEEIERFDEGPAGGYESWAVSQQEYD
jgi:hypothetical protein